MARASCPREGDFLGGMGEWGMTTNDHEWTRMDTNFHEFSRISRISRMGEAAGNEGDGWGGVF